MVIFWVLTVCGGVIRQYGNFYQNYNNFSKIVFSVYTRTCNFIIACPTAAALLYPKRYLRQKKKNSTELKVKTTIRLLHVGVIPTESLHDA